jgi:hypothetical protein
MVEAVRGVWEFFCPPDPSFSEIFGENADPVKIEEHMKALYKWRLKVSGTMALLVAGVIIASFTPWGFLRAGDVESVVERKLGEIKSEIASLKLQNAQMAPAITEILKSTTTTDICRIVARRKIEKSAIEQEALRGSLDVAQGKYKALTGEFYPESRCGGN